MAIRLRLTLKVLRFYAHSYSWLASYSAVYLPDFRSSEVGPTMHEIRKEKRNLEKLQVLLSPVEEPLLIEPGWTENVSPHGLRVQTEWPWPRDTQVIVLFSGSELWERARVVYLSASFRQFLCSRTRVWGSNG